MHRAEIDFDDTLFAAVEEKAKSLNLSVPTYIKKVLKKDVREKEIPSDKTDFSEFAGIWEDYDISQDAIRKKAWK